MFHLVKLTRQSRESDIERQSSLSSELNSPLNSRFCPQIRILIILSRSYLELLVLFGSAILG